MEFALELKWADGPKLNLVCLTGDRSAIKWHWPLVSFSSLVVPPQHLGMARSLIIPISVVLAWLTFAFVEKPVRGRHSRPIKVRFLVLAMAVVGVTGGVTFVCQGFVSFSQTAETAPFLARKRELGEWITDVRVTTCYLNNSDVASYAEECTQRGDPSIVLYGDSHAASLCPGFAQLQKSEHFALSQFTAGGCPPLLDTEVASRKNCVEVNRGVLAHVTDLQPTLLVLAGRWVRPELGLTPQQVQDRLKYSLEILKQRLPKTQIVMVGPVPQWIPDLPTVLASYINEHKSLPPAYLELPQRAGALEVQKMDSDLAQLAEQLQVRYVSLFSILCEQERCLTRVGDSLIDLVVFDDSHLNAPASELVVGKMRGELIK